MTTTQPISKTAKKYLAIIEKGHIEESELISLNSFINKSKENRELIFAAMQDQSQELTLSDEQNKKGYDFLMKLRFTPTGKERTNSPFGYREEKVLDNFSHFTLSDFYPANNHYYIRLYTCYAKDGASFEYYYNGKMNITG